MQIFKTLIPSATVDAYLAADYKVNTAKPFVLKIGKRSIELAEWFQINNENQAAYMTAWNPFGKRVSENENDIAELELITEIKSRNLSYLKGKSSDPSGIWPSEPSLLVLGISLEFAKGLVKRYYQDGFIYIGYDATPQLILLR